MKTYLMNTKVQLFLALVILAGCEPRDPPEQAALPDQITPAMITVAEQAITPEGLLEDIQTLSADAFGGRAPMTEGEILTLQFLQEEFSAAGLQPLFGRDYRQQVPLISIAADPATASLQLRNVSGLRQLQYSSEMMMWTSRDAGSINVADSELVFVGYGIRAPEYGWDDYADIDVSGKTVLMLVNDPGYVLQTPELFKGKAMTYYGRWTYKFEEAARQGAAGAIIIHETGAAAYPWQTVDNSWSGVQLHLDSSNGNLDALPFESWVRHEVAEELVAAAGYDLEELEQQALGAEFSAVELGWKVNAHLDNTRKKSVSYNMGGVIRGSRHPDEAFIYMAHWDHLGSSDPDFEGDDTIFNGASDNASGIAGLISLAQAFNRLPEPPARSVIFLAVTAEESGLLGSRWYGNNPQFPLHKTVAGLNMDNINVYGPTTDVTVVGYGNSELDNILAEQAGLQKRTVEAEPNPEKGSFYRSDQFNFARHGVPVLYPKPGIVHRELGPDYMAEQNRMYTQQRYHTAEDEILDSWDLRGLVEDLQLYFRFGIEIADNSNWPEWADGNEFKAIRESSLESR
jgi:Zn-dependent M28 family amino/carboxypeptidase